MKTKRTKKIAVISHPRSGSTYFLSILGQFHNTSALLELFHPYESVIRLHLNVGLREKASQLIDGLVLGDQTLSEFVHKNPLEYLARIKLYDGQDFLLYKVFPGHLDEVGLEAVVADSDLIIFLSRNVLHGYISECFARITGKYVGTDTSTVFTDFEENKFKSYNNQIFRFFRQVKGYTRKHMVKKVDIHYEDLIGREDVDQYCLRRLLEWELVMKPPDDYKEKLTKQDSRIFATDKVKNPDYMLKILKKYYLDYLNDVNCKMHSRNIL